MTTNDKRHARNLPINVSITKTPFWLRLTRGLLNFCLWSQPIALDNGNIALGQSAMPQLWDMASWPRAIAYSPQLNAITNMQLGIRITFQLDLFGLTMRGPRNFCVQLQGLPWRPRGSRYVRIEYQHLQCGSQGQIRCDAVRVKAW